MSWLDTIIEKGKELAKANCDPPWTVDYDWPLKSKPPSIVSTAPLGAPELIPVFPEGHPYASVCGYWYTREYIHKSPSTGYTISVAKYWNKNTNVTQWTVAAGDVGLIETKFPELYALLAPLPKNAPISSDIDDPEFPSISGGELEEYIEKVGSKDPDVPPEAKPTALAGFNWKWGALIVAGLLIAGSVIGKKRKKKGKKAKKRRR